MTYGEGKQPNKEYLEEGSTRTTRSAEIPPLSKASARYQRIRGRACSKGISRLEKGGGGVTQVFTHHFHGTPVISTSVRIVYVISGP